MRDDGTVEGQEGDVAWMARPHEGRRLGRRSAAASSRVRPPAWGDRHGIVRSRRCRGRPRRRGGPVPSDPPACEAKGSLGFMRGRAPVKQRSRSDPRRSRWGCKTAFACLARSARSLRHLAEGANPACEGDARFVRPFATRPRSPSRSHDPHRFDGWQTWGFSVDFWGNHGNRWGNMANRAARRPVDSRSVAASMGRRGDRGTQAADWAAESAATQRARRVPIARAWSTGIPWDSATSRAPDSVRSTRAAR